MPLISKRNLENRNKYGISKKDMIGDLKGFPVGVVVRMMDEQELQGNEPNVRVFQKERCQGDCGFERGGGFNWDKTVTGYDFWQYVILSRNFEKFFKVYPEYEKYN